MTDLVRLDIGYVHCDEPLAAHCSWQIGGPADLLVEPTSIEKVGTLLTYVIEHQILLVLIGQGTNLLFDDVGVRGAVLKLGSTFSEIEIVGNTLTAEAGVWVPQLARLVMMNGGSQRKGIGGNVRWVWVVDSSG